jgi:act minimal PKS acyl carrier protein
MTDQEFTLDDLRRILREGAGTDDSIDLDGDIADAEFTALGYDSLALLETGTRIEREYDIRLGDAAMTDAVTPGELITIVNAALAAQRAA